MIHTFPKFESLVKSRLDTNDNNYVKKLYELMGRCFQGKAQTKWTKVIAKVDESSRTADTFKDAQKDYLEAIAEIKNLGDCLIRQLRDRSKPAAMALDDYIDRRDEWKRYIDGTDSLLRKTLAMPTDQEWAEQIFSQQPKNHQLKYAEEHEDVETNIDKLKQFFNGCHTRDVGDGTYARVLKNSRDARKARLQKERGENKNTHRSDRGNRWNSRSTRDRRDYDRRDNDRYKRDNRELQEYERQKTGYYR